MSQYGELIVKSIPSGDPPAGASADASSGERRRARRASGTEKVYLYLMCRSHLGFLSPFCPPRGSHSVVRVYHPLILADGAVASRPLW